MLIIGAKGFAKEVLEILHQQNNLQVIAFYDDVSPQMPEMLYGKYPVLRNEDHVLDFFKRNGENFTLGIGAPFLRYTLYMKFIKLGGKLKSTVSQRAEVGHYDLDIGEGCNILSGAIIGNGSQLGIGNIIYYNSIIAHDTKVGDFVEISPGATILGRCKIGSFSQIGANATILPDITIGENVLVGAGALVTKNIPDNSVAVGVPAKVVRQNVNLLVENERH